MNGMRTIITTKTLSVFFFLAAFAGAMRAALSPVQRYVFCDQKIPVDMQTSIKQLIEKAAIRSIGADGLCAELQKEYPSVQAVSISYKGSLTAHITIKAYMPRVCLTSALPGQKEYCVCAGGLVLEKKYFNDLFTQGMQTVIIEGNNFEEKRLDADLIVCVLELKRAHFDEYTIAWRSKVEILLQSRVSNSILIADAIMVHDNERLACVERILRSDAERYPYGIKADIRLNDEIVRSPLQEGFIKNEKSVNV